MITVLQELLSIESIAEKNGGSYPFGAGAARALDYILDVCQSLGFRVKNENYRYGYAEIGQGEQLIGILAHLDTVPAGEGWHYPPFAGTEADGRLYGRGVQDDKGPAVAAVFAMKDLLDSGRPLHKRIRILFGQDEETGDWDDIAAYKAHEQHFDCGFTPDGQFPAIYGEKGIMLAQLAMDQPESGLAEAEGGSAPNMVADWCRARVCGKLYETFGKSAHSSAPWEGENAIAKLMNQLAELEHPPAFARAYQALIGNDFSGASLNCDVRDEASGSLTMNPGRLECEEGKVKLTLDIRYPVTFTREELLERIRRAAEPFGIAVSCPYSMDPVYLDRQGPVIESLLSAYRGVTGDMSAPKVTGGGTYARAMKNLAAFGPCFPGKLSTEHEADEYMEISDLKMLRTIYRKALENLLVL